MADLKIPKIVGAGFLASFILFVGFYIPVTQALGNQEISNPEISFLIFLFGLLCIGGIAGTMILYSSRNIWKIDDKYSNSFGFFNIGDKITLLNRKFTALQLTILSFIIFPTISLLSAITQFAGFTGLRVLPQQFTPGESLAFSTLLIPSAEEAMSTLFIGILVLLLIFLAIKINMSKTNFKTFYFVIIPILLGIIAVIWHINVYENSDVNLLIVFIFWATKTFIQLAVGFFIVAWAMHMSNNFFIDFSRLFSSDTVMITAFAIIFILTALYLFLYRGRLLGTRRSNK